MSPTTRNHAEHAPPPLRSGEDRPLELDLNEIAERQLLARMLPRDYDDWSQALSRVGFCANPIRLVGRSEEFDTITGSLIRSYGSADERLGVTFTRCGNRRTDKCESCSRLYAADTLQLIRRHRRRQDRPGVRGRQPAGLRHPHRPLLRTRARDRPNGGRCRPRRDAGHRCPHGLPTPCMTVHGEDDPNVGQPLCAGCYDYASQVRWQWWAPDWRYPRAGRATVRSLLPMWLQERRHSVSAKTDVSDAALVRLVPHSLAALSVNAVTDREVSRALIALTQSGLAESSVRRFRASLSSFFAWAVRERLILANPVVLTRVPKVGGAARRSGPRLRGGPDADARGTAGRAGGRPGAPQRTGTRRGHTKRGGVRMAKEEPRPTWRVCAGQTGFRRVELRGFEPLTFSLRTRRATNCATAPRCGRNCNTRRERTTNRLTHARRASPSDRCRRGGSPRPRSPQAPAASAPWGA